ncbi:MAG: BatA domain-containing protein [Pirellula sp.]|jgi:hypothetical protein|nr:BatA domain-containing protein [Pirellula sp.]
MQFVFQPLAWGFLLVLVPLLIHLINLVRHRRTPWAAMEFLLESYRKNRRWVWLKQALLIASRMLAMALLVAMLAQWITGSKWLSGFGRTTTHHYVILDDSASMGDTANGKSAYQTALGSIAAIANAANQGSQQHLLSIFRASRGALAANRVVESADAPTATEANSTNEVRADAIADLLARTIPADATGLLSKINSTTPTQLECSFDETLAAVAPLLQSDQSDRAIVYLMSDFRTKDWNNATILKQRLQSLRRDPVEIQLVDCVENRHENLTLAAIEPRQEVLAAGVPTMINVTVVNHGAAPVRNVAVRVQAIDYSRKDGEPKPAESYSGVVTELPPLLLDRIEPGESVTRNVQVVFPKSGSHVITAELPPDAISADNTGRCVLDLVDGVRVLLVDGDPGGKHSFFFESALNPGGNARTGLLIAREGPEYLRDTDAEGLDPYACIVLQSVPSLDPRALANLHRYVSRGGGLAIWFGDNLTANDYLRNYAALAKPISGLADTSPLIPFGLMGPVDLPKDPTDGTPDIIADNHPIFAPLLGLSSSPFQFVRIQRYVEIEPRDTNDKRWKPVATLRNKKPLMVDYSLGDGRVLIALTSLDRRWSNWPQDPTFVVAALKMVGYLSSFRTTETSKLVGSGLRWDFSAQEMLPETQLICPAPTGRNIRPALQINGETIGENGLRANLEIRPDSDSEDIVRALTTAGLFEWWGTAVQGDSIVKNLARNTPPAEGNTERITATDLSNALNGVKYTYRPAGSVGSNLALSGMSNRNLMLMAILLLLLVAEQWLAWSASYHLPKR